MAAGGPCAADTVGGDFNPVRSVAHIPRDHRRKDPSLHQHRRLRLFLVTIHVSLSLSYTGMFIEYEVELQFLDINLEMGSSLF